MLPARIATLLLLGPGTILLASANNQAQVGDTKPDSLQRFEQTRERIKAEFSVTSHAPRGRSNRHRCIVTTDEIAVFSDGSPDGVTGYTEDGRPVWEMEEAVLTMKDAVWEKRQGSAGGSLRTGSAAKNRSNSLDFRTLGVTPSAPLTARPSEAYPPRQNGVPQRVEYSETIEASGIHVVCGRNLDDRRTTVWYIDPNFGWNATRVEEWFDGRLLAAKESTYELQNGLWVPVKVVSLGPDDDVRSITELRYTKVNSPDLPKTLTPSDIGFFVGTNVNVDDGVSGEHRMFDGEKAVPDEEFYQRVRAGELQFDPRVLAQLRGGGGMRIGSPHAPPASMPVTTQPASSPAEWRQGIDARLRRWLTRADPGADPWDEYVARFIERCKLDADQAERCLAILKDSKERRDSIVQQRRDRLEKLAQQPIQTESDARIIEEQIDRIVAPAEKVLADMKNRLERVPTRKQLEAAGLDGERKQ